MKPKTSVVTGQSDDITNVEPITDYSADVLVGLQSNIPLVQNVLLIWLDPNIDENNADCRNTIKQIRRIVNSVNTFKDKEECIEFVQRMNTEKICMIISGAVGQHIVPSVHGMSQVDSIFIFCNDKEYHEQWVHEWSKIKGVYIEILPICDALKQAAQQCEQNAVSMSFLPIVDGPIKNLDELEPSFMYIQIMKEILLAINFEPKHIQQYIDYCHEIYAENERELRNIQKFERKYDEETPIWWYTLECFLYPMINRALRMLDIDLIIKVGFYIKDLYRNITELHQEQFNNAEPNDQFIVYRGQGMSKTEFEQMNKTQGGLISFNNFLSTSKKQSVSLGFANRALANPDLVGVLFTITIDPSQSTTPFASIKNVSYIKNEDEVLFAMQTVFRINTITPISGNPRLFEVELSLTGNNDKDLRQLTDYIQKETALDSEGWYRLGAVLYKMGQFDKCEQVYQILLEQTTNEIQKVGIYGQLGLAKYSQGEYDKAITFYEKTVEIYNKNLPSTNLDLASTYNNIGALYGQKGEYTKALPYFEKAFAIRQETLPSNHPNLASSYTNIGEAYRNMHEYSKALPYYQNALEMQQQSLPANHPNLANCYNNIGALYGQTDEYAKALPYFEKSLEIRQRSLLPNHPDLANSYNNIGTVYKNMNENSKALSYYERSLEIQQQSLHPNRPDLSLSYFNIGDVCFKMGDFSKALSYYEKSLDIKQQSLSANQSEVAAAYATFGLLSENMGNYSKAYSFFERSLEIAQRSLPEDHPTVKQYRSNLERIKNRL